MSTPITKPHILVFTGPFVSHTIVTLNTIYRLLDTFTVHLLAHSTKLILKHIESAGLGTAPIVSGDLIIDAILQDGELEDWIDERARPFTDFYFKPTLAAHVDKALGALEVKYGQDAFKAVIMDLFYTPTLDIYRAHKMKVLVIYTAAATFFDLFQSVSKESVESDPDGLLTIPGLNGRDGKLVEFKNIDLVEITSPVAALIGMGGSVRDRVDGVIFGAGCVPLEGTIRDAAPKRGAPSFFTGPVCPEWFLKVIEGDEDLRAQRVNELTPEQKVAIDFLDKQPERSVLYIALGSGRFFTGEQCKLIHDTVTRLNIPTLFVNRSSQDSATLFPGADTSKFCVVKWAPQLDVLAHPSVRCCFSHAGWGSVTESLLSSIPMLAAPVFGDQFIDAKWMEALGTSFGQVSINPRVHSNRTPRFPEGAEPQLEALLGAVYNQQQWEEKRKVSLDIGTRMRAAALGTDGTKNGELDALKSVLLSFY
ncbi:glycosyltransferase family 1 protein [Cylindrobasidium torrendii FP15055 ss-10]|uniref:Glycosyltransferase family 1 protein n=1 Tax=Cylindrobasidium torrendii FP15055 ss-10 TaxID=1314674 RepID=A0A0D7BEY4_9AGAR|nr:glycosyltransferase family 1 protein [Cylindrobasidium torrendii FP15055 ss-10]